MSALIDLAPTHAFRQLDAQGVIRSPLLRRKRLDEKPVVLVKDDRVLCLIDRLPNDVLEIVFSFVPLRGVPVMFLVCKRWTKCLRMFSSSLWEHWFASRVWLVRDTALHSAMDHKKRRVDWKAATQRHMVVEKGWVSGQPRVVREVKQAHDRIIINIQCDQDNIVSGSMDKTVKLWDRNTTLLKRTIHHDAPVLCFQYSNSRLVSGAKNVTVWDMNTGNCLQTLKSPFPCNALRFNDKDLVYGDSQAIFFNDLETGDLKKSVDINYLRALVLQDNMMISGHMFDIKGWDMRTYENVWNISSGASTNCMQVGLDKVFSYVAGGKTLNVHDLRTMKNVATIDEDIIFGLSLDGNKLVTANPFFIKVWEANTMTERSLVLPPSKRAGYFSFVHTTWDHMTCGESGSPSILLYDF